MLTIIEKLRARKRVYIANPDTGKKYSIEPAYWEGVRLGWTFRDEDGSIPKGYKGVMLDPETIENTCFCLVEREPPGVVVESGEERKKPRLQHYHAKCLPDEYQGDFTGQRKIRFFEPDNSNACFECKELI